MTMWSSVHEPVGAPVRDRPAPLGHILLAIDDLAVRDLVADVLRAHDWPLYIVADPTTAIETAHQQFPDAIIAYVSPHRLDKFALLRTIRDSSMIGHIPVILVSGDTDEELHSEAFELGADDYIITPFNPSVFAARIASHARLVKIPNVRDGQRTKHARRRKMRTQRKANSWRR
jgi:DNA-binding response OmpR family regulator